MLRRDGVCLASLRYRRPYWMLFLKGVDNWRIYTVIQQPEHQRTEMLYQAWLGGLDRPYVRPKCMAHQPVWLSKKRHMLQKARLDGPETVLERYVLEWHKRFHSFQGTEKPTPDDLHTAFDLVERPLDLSYACQLLNQCRNIYHIRLDETSFTVFMEACLRVDRMDCVRYALEHAEQLGFWHVDENCRRFLEGKQTWYRQTSDEDLQQVGMGAVADEEGLRPLHETSGSVASPGGAPLADGSPAPAKMGEGEEEEELVDEEIARLQAELEALEGEMAQDDPSKGP